MENVKQKFKDALESMSYAEKIELLKAWEAILPPPSSYECQVCLGRGRNSCLRWVSSCELTDQAIIVHLSDDRCFIDEGLNDLVPALLQVCDTSFSPNWSVSSTLVDPAPTEEVSGDG